MKRVLVLTCSVIALACAAPAAALAQQPAAAPAATATTTAPPIAFQVRELPNGLKVYSARDPNTSSVTVQVWYGVGSKDDPQGRSGFAHLFEHMMFKATRNLPSESLDRMTEDVGGFNNASTYDDFTNYYEVVPANHLERLLFAEADRMGSLVVDEATFISERDVVKEELRQRVLATPYGRLFYILMPQHSFAEHPYRRPGIGSIAELDAASIDDVRRFHATYYRPDNAALIVMGDFDQAQLDAWVDKYFTPIAKPARPLPANDVTEPERTAARTVEAYAPNVPLPAVLVSYQAPDYGHEDTAAMLVLDAVLSMGESSRLYQSLVYDQEVANEADTYADGLQQQAGLFAVYAIAAGGKTIDELQAAVHAEVRKLREAPVSQAELAEARNQIVANTLRERETVDQRAFALGYGLALTGDPSYADKLLAAIQRVTAEDVQRVARKYLREDRAVTIRYQDDAQRPAGHADTPWDGVDAPVTLDTLAEAGPEVRLAPPEQRAAVPAPGPERPLATPAVVERTLANGLRVLVARTDRLPLVNAYLMIDAGTAADPEGKAGVANLTAALLTQGAAGKTAPQIAADVEALGASVGAGAGYDGSNAYANSPTAVFPQTLALMAQVVRRPDFDAQELERQRTQILDGLAVAMSNPGQIAGLTVGRVVFGAAPYGAPTGGTTDTLPTITREDLAAFHAAQWRPSQATLVFSGDIEPEAAFALAEREFGDWAEPARPAAQPASPAGAPLPPRVVVIDLPGTGQAAVTAAMRGVSRADPAFYPLEVGVDVLGGGYSSRLSQEIRIKRGLSYGAYAGLAGRKDDGLLTASAQTKNESALEVAEIMLAEIGRMSAEAASESELTARKAVLVGGFGRSLETVNGLGGQVAELALHDLPLSELADYAPKVRAVTAAAVRQAMARELPADQVSLVIVGDAQQFLPALRARFPDLEVIPVGELDLDEASLR